ncbi:ATP-binding protein [[Actinomadura] parvosata]|nr:ATP-binding protein [Nonomuraea sp. ATCC 55076]
MRIAIVVSFDRTSSAELVTNLRAFLTRPDHPLETALVVTRQGPHVRLDTVLVREGSDCQSLVTELYGKAAARFEEVRASLPEDTKPPLPSSRRPAAEPIPAGTWLVPTGTGTQWDCAGVWIDAGLLGEGIPAVGDWTVFVRYGVEGLTHAVTAVARVREVNLAIGPLRLEFDRLAVPDGSADLTLSAFDPGMTLEIVPLTWSQATSAFAAQSIREPDLLAGASFTPADLILDLVNGAYPKNLLFSVVSSLRRGRHLFIVGPKGSGKSRLARGLAQSAWRAWLNRGYQILSGASYWSLETALGPAEDGISIPSSSPAPECGPLLLAVQSDHWVIVEDLGCEDAEHALPVIEAAMARSEARTIFGPARRPTLMFNGKSDQRGFSVQREGWWRVTVTSPDALEEFSPRTRKVIHRFFDVVDVQDPHGPVVPAFRLQDVMHPELATLFSLRLRAAGGDITMGNVEPAIAYLNDRLALAGHTDAPLDLPGLVEEAMAILRS